MIINCATFLCVIDHITERSFVISDLDGVVMAAKSHGFGPEGFKQYHGQHFGELSVPKIMEFAYVLNNHTNYVPVSSQLNDYLSNSHGQTIIGLTARTPWFSEETLAQLNSVEMKFSTGFKCPSITEASIKGGVIFVGHHPDTGLSNDKGKVIKDMIAYGCIECDAEIIFIDDSIGNLFQVETALQDLNINFIGIHYTEHHDLIRKKYSQEAVSKIIECQWQSFEECGYIPSDQECAELAGNCQPKCPEPLQWR